MTDIPAVEVWTLCGRTGNNPGSSPCDRKRGHTDVCSWAIGRLHRERGDFEREATTLRVVADHAGALDDLREQVKTARAELQQTLSAGRGATATIDRLRRDAERLRERLREAHDESELRRELAASQSLWEQEHARAEDLRDRLEDAQATLAAARTELVWAQEELAGVRADLDAVRAAGVSRAPGVTVHWHGGPEAPPDAAPGDEWTAENGSRFVKTADDGWQALPDLHAEALRAAWEQIEAVTRTWVQ